jgi:alpha/beta superfamily hydrolase
MIDSSREQVTFGAGHRLSGTLFSGSNVHTLLVFVHPWTWLGGRGCIFDDLAHRLCVESGTFACLTFDLRGAGSSKGCSTFTGKAEVEDVESGVQFMKARYPDRRMLLIGYSAGACISGSAAAACGVQGYIGLAYPCGWITSIAFSSHPDKLELFKGPKLLVSGDSDGFTSESQLRKRFEKNTNIQIEILAGVGHFDILGESGIVKRIVEFCLNV